MVSKEFANYMAEQEYFDWANTVKKMIDSITDIFVKEYLRYTPDTDEYVQKAVVFKIRRIVKAQKYRVLFELFSDSVKFDEMRNPEWWEGILYKKGFSLGKDRYELVTDAIDVAADQLDADDQLRCCMPKGMGETP